MSDLSLGKFCFVYRPNKPHSPFLPQNMTFFSLPILFQTRIILEGARRKVWTRVPTPLAETQRTNRNAAWFQKTLKSLLVSSISSTTSFSHLSLNQSVAEETLTRISNVSCISAVEKWGDTYGCEGLGWRSPPRGFWSACGWVTEFLSRWYHGVKTF